VILVDPKQWSPIDWHAGLYHYVRTKVQRHYGKKNTEVNTKRISSGSRANESTSSNDVVPLSSYEGTKGVSKEHQLIEDNDSNKFTVMLTCTAWIKRVPFVFVGSEQTSTKEARAKRARGSGGFPQERRPIRRPERSEPGVLRNSPRKERPYEGPSEASPGV
jgi:hypothetical protein